VQNNIDIRISPKTNSRGAMGLFIYLNLWQPTKKMLKDKKFNIYHENALAHIQISTSADNFVHGFDFNFDGEGHLYHWNPGLIKNYLQLLAIELKSGKKTNFQDDVTDKTQIKQLRTKTLYFPESNINKMGMFMAQGKTVDKKDLFDDYKFNYKVLPEDELGEKYWPMGNNFIMHYLLGTTQTS
jgi:hypothetical protein